jgi:tetratricopeptide (TPR) repeat protein
VNRQEAMHGRNHRATLVALGNLGVNYKDAGRYKEAIPLLEEAFRAVKKHPEMRPFIKQLLDTYYKSGDYTKDVNLLQEVLSEARIELPKEAPQLGTLLALTARGLMDQMKWTEAESLIRECLVLREKKEPDVWTTFVTYSVLGGILMGQKKYADAEPLLLKGYEGIKQRESKVPLKYKALRLSEAVERLVQMYEATGKQDEAAKWRKELEAIKDKKEMEVIKDKKE